MKQRILFLYLTKHSGHYAAAVAVEAAAQRLNGGVESMLLDSFSHANPLLSKMTLKAYLAALKTAPEIWEWMYDNPAFQKRTALIRDLLNRGNSRKMEKVLREFNPDVVVCTQAFACGVLAAWKQKTGNRLPALVGVLTDYVAHRYWAHPQVDMYVVPNDATRGTLIAQGVAPDRIRVHGIPVNDRFITPVNKDTVYQSLDLKPGLPMLLLMGGSLGLGPMKSVIRKLDQLPQPFYIVAVTGKNEELRERLERRGAKLHHQTRIFSFVENVNELMDAAELVVTKPGGITTAECLIKRLPMIIINPIPGQEAKNTDLLLAQNVAVKAEKSSDVANLVDEFLRNPELLRAMREAARSLGRPQAARDAAVDILSLCANRP